MPAKSPGLCENFENPLIFAADSVFFATPNQKNPNPLICAEIFSSQSPHHAEKIDKASSDQPRTCRCEGHRHPFLGSQLAGNLLLITRTSAATFTEFRLHQSSAASWNLRRLESSGKNPLPSLVRLFTPEKSPEMAGYAEDEGSPLVPLRLCNTSARCFLRSNKQNQRRL
ncbi:hypothetical protein U1Q18_018389 [Sarracenia purpurea var. burkii]